MREMKDSGLKWIGQIPNGWEVNRIKYLFKTAKGLSVTKDNLIEEGLPVISYGQIHSKINTGVIVADELRRFVSYDYRKYVSSKLEKFDFAFADTSEDYEGCGNCVYKRTDDELYGGYHVVILHSIKKEDNRYFAYLFQTDAWREQIRTKASGVKVFSVTQKIINEASVIIPPVEMQARISNFLDAKCAEIDALTADIQTQIDTLEQYKRSVITESVTKGLNPDVEMKDSGTPWCPLIPIHWKYANPKALFTQRLDRAYPGDKQLTASQEYGVIYQDEYMELTGTKIVTVMKDFSILKHVEPNDFVISMRSFQGGLEYSERRGSISSAYVMLIPNNEYVYPPFYRWFFKSSKYINAIQSTSNLVRDGQAMRYANFAQVPLFIIPLDEQKQISEYLDEKVRKIDEILKIKKNQLEILAEYKKSLIYEYVT